MGTKDNYEISSKYSAELNGKYSKQGASKGQNTKESILKSIKQQQKNNKK